MACQKLIVASYRVVLDFKIPLIFVRFTSFDQGGQWKGDFNCTFLNNDAKNKQPKKQQKEKSKTGYCIGFEINVLNLELYTGRYV